MSEDMNEECRHLLTRRFCADCNGLAERQKQESAADYARVLALPGWFASTWPGLCARCYEPFKTGTPIRKATALDRLPSNEKVWIAACCAPEAEE